MAGAVAFPEAKKLWAVYQDQNDGTEVREPLELLDGTFELRKVVLMPGPVRFELEGSARVYRQKYPFRFEVKEDALPPLRDVHENPMSGHRHVSTPAAPATRSRNVFSI